MAWVGIDAAGTFTDFVGYHPETGELRVVKVPSDPARPDEVFRAGFQALYEDIAAAERLIRGGRRSPSHGRVVREARAALLRARRRGPGAG